MCDDEFDSARGRVHQPAHLAIQIFEYTDRWFIFEPPIGRKRMTSGRTNCFENHEELLHLIDQPLHL